jgi:CRP-like cAMP-binding protein
MNKTKILQEDTFLMRQGEQSTEIYLLLSEKLSVLKRKGDVEKKIGEISEGELVGEMSFLDGAPRSTSVRAMTTSEVLIIKRSQFEETIESFPTWYKTLYQTIVDRLRKTSSKIKV